MKTESKYNPLKGIEELRNAVNWCNYRNEFRNENKTAVQLINEYRKYKRETL